MRTQLPALKQQLLQNPLIESVAAASNPIGTNAIGSNGFNFEMESNKPGEQGKISETSKMVQDFMIDADYVNTLQIKMAAGRNFSDSMPTDKYGSVMVNEALVKDLGWKNAIGKKIQFNIPAFKGPVQVTVVGVVKDFNFYSLQHKIVPLILQMPPVVKEEDNLYVRVSKKNVAGALQYLKQTYRRFDAANDIEYSFLDENFARQYQTEQKQGSIIFIFTTIAISIACLGLLGLVTFAAGQRTKEIGIRKVLGASVSSIVTLLSKDFVKLVLLAVVIATPVAWYTMDKWLQNFAYRISIGWGIFLVAGSIAVTIALVTVSFQAVKTALANPVKALRSE